MAPRKGFVSSDLPTHTALKVWVSVEKHQIRETYPGSQTHIARHQDQSLSPSPLATVHPSRSLLGSLPQLLTGHCTCPLLLPPVLSVTHSSFGQQCSCNLSLILFEPSGASSKWHQIIFLV